MEGDVLKLLALTFWFLEKVAALVIGTIAITAFAIAIYMAIIVCVRLIESYASRAKLALKRKLDENMVERRMRERERYINRPRKKPQSD